MDLVDTLRRDWRKERPELDTSAMDVVGRIYMLYDALSSSVGKALEPFELGYTDLDVLATLRRIGAPYRLRPADLLNTVVIQSGSLTACLDRLEKKQLIRRVATPGDRRSRSVQLSRAGEKLIDQAIEQRFEDACRCVVGLTRDDRRQLKSLLKKMLTCIEQHAKE